MNRKRNILGSFRAQMSRDVSIDVFSLSSGARFLFFYFKNEIRDIENWDALACPWIEKLALDAKLIGFGGAMKSRQRSVPLPYFGESSELWTVEEGLEFRLKGENVLNPGLFLDQSLNRSQLRRMIVDAKLKGSCLNLFSYTGAFSLVARSCGLETVSVDVSHTYLEWEKENHIQNFKDLQGASFFREDARDFLRRTKRKYSVIVLDPPSFSRGNKRPIQVRQDLPAMFSRCLDLLEDRGVIFVSSNLSRWKREDFEEVLLEIVRKGGHLLQRKPGKVDSSFPKNHALNSLFFYRL